MNTTVASSLGGKYLTIKLDNEAYALSVLKVREIMRFTKITPVAQMPAYVRGVMNLRGKVVPVIDLRVKFGLAAEVLDRTCIVVVHVVHPSGREILMGVIVDAVEDVAAISDEQIEDTPYLGGKIGTDYLLGMAKVKGELKLLLNVDRVVSVDTVEAVTRVA